jgi:hypothetical protein
MGVSFINVNLLQKAGISIRHILVSSSSIPVWHPPCSMGLCCTDLGWVGGEGGGCLPDAHTPSLQWLWWGEVASYVAAASTWAAVRIGCAREKNQSEVWHSTLEDRHKDASWFYFPKLIDQS